MPLPKRIKPLVFGVVSTALLIAGTWTQSALAQEAAAMTCDQLWYARNAIYARNGYCFETPRARAVFGHGCFPPYGALTGWERNRVNELQYWERQKGC